MKSNEQMKRYNINLTMKEIVFILGALNEIIKDLKKEKKNELTNIYRLLSTYYE